MGSSGVAADPGVTTGTGMTGGNGVAANTSMGVNGVVTSEFRGCGSASPTWNPNSLLLGW